MSTDNKQPPQTGKNFTTNPRKRRWNGNNRGGNFRRAGRDKHRRIDAAVSAVPLTTDHTGFLFSCGPRQEDRAANEGIRLLHRIYDEHFADAIADDAPTGPDANTPPTTTAAAPPDGSSPPDQTDKPVTPTAASTEDPEKNSASAAPATAAAPPPAPGPTAALDAELAELRSSGPAFTRVDPRLASAAFIAPRPGGPPVAAVVEAALRAARKTGHAGVRLAHRLMPVHATCHADAPAAATAAERVARAHFPAAPATFAVIFRARLNNGAKRDTFIPAVAEAVAAIDKGYTVNLSKPDVVLVVEVIKTACCVGAFGPYFELAKLNLHEAANPSTPKGKEGEKSAAEKEGDAKEAAGVAPGATDEVEGEGKNRTTGGEEGGDEDANGRKERDADLKDDTDGNGKAKLENDAGAEGNDDAKAGVKVDGGAKEDGKTDAKDEAKDEAKPEEQVKAVTKAVNASTDAGVDASVEASDLKDDTAK